MKARINGTKIYFDVEGMQLIPEGPVMKERPVCFTVPGGPGCDHSMYKPALSPLAEQVQLVYIDNRGCGKSDPCDKTTYNLEQNTDDLEALRKYLGLDKIIVLGQSYGGMVAIRYAAKYPDNLLALILVTTSHHNRFTEDAKKYVEEHGTEEQKALAQNLWNGTFESVEQLRDFTYALGPFYATSFNSAEAGQGFSRMKPSIEALNMGFSGELKKLDLTTDLPRIKAPTLVIGGKYDWITPYQASEEIAALIPDARLAIMEESSHEVFADQPGKTIGIIKDFLDEVVNNQSPGGSAQ